MPTKINSSGSTVPLTRGQKVKEKINRFGSWVSSGIKRLIRFFSPKKKYINNTDKQTRHTTEQHPLKMRNVKLQAGSPADNSKTAKSKTAKSKTDSPKAANPKSTTGASNTGDNPFMLQRQVLQQELKNNFAEQLSLMKEMGKAERLPRQHYRTDLPPTLPRPCGLADIFMEQYRSGLSLEGRKKLLDQNRDILVEALYALENQNLDEMQDVIDKARNLTDSTGESLGASVTESVLLQSLERLVNPEAKSSELSPEDQAFLKAELGADDDQKWKAGYSASLIREFESLVREQSSDRQESIKSDILGSMSLSDFSINTDNDATPPQ